MDVTSQTMDKKKTQENPLSSSLKSSQPQQYQRSDVWNHAKEDPTLSLGPIAASQETTTATRPTRPGHTRNAVEDEGPENDGDSLARAQTHPMSQEEEEEEELGDESQYNNDSLDDDCSSMSTFSLSVLVSQSSIGEVKVSSFTKPPEMTSIHANPTFPGVEEVDRERLLSLERTNKVHDLQRQVESLQKENHKLQEEVEFLRADRALLSPTKYQVELDSMRLVAEQIQQESEEKIQMLQRENNRLQDEMDRLQQEQLQMQQMDKKEKERLHQQQQQQNDIWKHLFYTLLEQICLLEESGLRVDASLRMDHVVRDVVTEIKGEQVRQLDTFMERLAKGCGRSHVSESTVTTNHGKSNGSSLQDSASNGKYVSVAVDTEDLMSMGLFSSATTLTSHVNGSMTSHVNGSMHWQQTISDLQLENVSLKGSNEHMRGQLHRSRQEIQSLRESLSKSGSAISALTEKCRMYANSMNQQVLEQQNAELLQEIKILTENQKVVEEENRRVVQRCVELEAVAEDATDECEELVARLTEMERELRQVRDERDNLLISHEDYENATTEREEEHQKIRDEMTEKCQSLEAKCNSLLEAKDELADKMEMMNNLKAKLDGELDIMRKTIEDKDTQISSLESQLAQMQKQLCSEEDKFTEFSKEIKVLKEENTHLHDQQESLRKRQQGVADLEDECSRLRNLNGMIKAKIEITNSELNKIKTQNASLVQQLASVRSECDALRIENVALSDNKSDMEVDMRRYEKECEEQKTLTSKVEKELGKVITIRDELQKQNSSLRKQLQDCEAAKSALEKNLEALQTKNYTLRGGAMSTYDTVVVKLPESEKRVSNNIRQPNPSPHTYVSTPVGVQSPDTILGDTVTPATWSARSTGPLTGPSSNNIDPMDDQLQRIQAATEKAALILKNISNFRIKQGTSAKFEEPTSYTTNLTAEKDKKKNSLNKTEAFVHNILDSCSK